MHITGPNPWTDFFERFHEFIGAWTTGQRRVDPIALAGRLNNDAFSLRRHGRLSAPPGSRTVAATLRQAKHVATTEDALAAVAGFLQSGLNRGLNANSLAALSEQVAVKLQSAYL